MFKNRNHKKYIKKTQKKNGGSRFPKSKNSAGIFFPLTLFKGKYQVMPDSIEKHHVEGFLDSLFNSEIFLRKTRNDLSKINMKKMYNDYKSYYKKNIVEEIINTPSINKKISDLNKINQIIDAIHIRSNTISKPPSMDIQRQGIIAGGSSAIGGIVIVLLGAFVWHIKDNLCKKQTAENDEDEEEFDYIDERNGNGQTTIASIMSKASIKYRENLTKGTRTSRRQKTGDYEEFEQSKDNRRTVLGCIFDNGKTCMFKYSKNPHYIPLYKIETKVYDQLKAQGGNYPVDVIDYYGTSGNTINVGKNLQLPFAIQIEGQRYNSVIKVPEQGKYFYFAMEWNADFQTLAQALVKKTAAQRNWAIQSVCDSLGRLNSNYGFFHGDMKPDNVMINMKDFDTVKKTYAIKHVDFDFSGILGAVKNDRMASAYFIDSQEKVEEYIQSRTSPGRSSEAKDFLYFFDIYRLWCSIPTTWRNGRYDTSTSNTINASNGNIHFKFKDFVDFFINDGNTKLEFLKQKDLKNRNLRTLISNIGKELNIPRNNLDWNYTLMDEVIVFQLFEYICEINGLWGRTLDSSDDDDIISSGSSDGNQPISSSRASSTNRSRRSNRRKSSSDSEDDYNPAPPGLKDTFSMKRKGRNKTQKRATRKSSQKKSSKGSRTYVDNESNRRLGRVGKPY